MAGPSSSSPCSSTTRKGRSNRGGVNFWERYQEWKKTPAGQKRSGSELIGSPETIAERLRELEKAHVDQVILLNQAGKNSHEDICTSLKLFSEKVMPQFQVGHREQEAWKTAVLNGEIQLEEIDTEPFNFAARPQADPTAEPRGPGHGRRRQRPSGGAGDPELTAVGRSRIRRRRPPALPYPGSPG